MYLHDYGKYIVSSSPLMFPKEYQANRWYQSFDSFLQNELKFSANERIIRFVLNGIEISKITMYRGESNYISLDTMGFSVGGKIRSAKLYKRLNSHFQRKANKNPKFRMQADFFKSFPVFTEKAEDE